MAGVVAGGWALDMVHFGPFTLSDGGGGPSAQGASESTGPAEPVEAAEPEAPPLDPALVAFDQVSDSVTSTVELYRQRSGGFSAGQVQCGPLASALIAVEEVWITYNVSGKPPDLVLDAGRTATDELLYAQVDSVESHFDQSGCPRP